MNKTDSLSNKNAAIQEMMSSGNGLMNFYRFVAQNPHLSLREACQIVVERSNASVCFSYEEWNAMGIQQADDTPVHCYNKHGRLFRGFADKQERARNGRYFVYRRTDGQRLRHGLKRFGNGGISQSYGGQSRR